MNPRGYLQWRTRRAKTSWAASRILERDRWRFVARELWPRQATATYVYSGHNVTMTHHTEDIAAFKELFVTEIYNLPAGWNTSTPKRTADLGGNVGMFALYAAINWPSARIVAFEPDPANAAKYKTMVNDNAINCELVEACAGASAGTVKFAVGHQAHSYITDDSSGVDIPVVDVYDYLEGVEFLKMDIEGGEWPILLDERFASTSASIVCLEYHRHLCPTEDPRGLATEILEAAGFEVRLIDHDERVGAGVLHARRVA